MDSEAQGGEAPPREPGSVRLADRYEIRGTPLPELGSPQAQAVAAVDQRNPDRSLMALLCPRHLGLRLETLGSARRIERAHVLRPVEWGVVDWPVPRGAADGGWRQPVLISERPGGARLMPRRSAGGAQAAVEPMGEEALTRRVLRPLVHALRDLHAAGIAHRAIRPDNLFWRDGGGGEAVLGEGWIGLPGADQPALFETIPHGMALPAGRGPGRMADDLYSLGATLAALLAGRHPAADLDEDALIAAKIGQGSFAVLAGALRLSAPMIEVLRGLLADQPADRWGLNDLELWFDGRRLSPKAPNLPIQAARPMVFAETEYWSRPALAHGLAKRWTQAVGYMAEAGIGVWLRRSLNDEKGGSTVDGLIAGGGEGRNGADHQLARLLMILDPAAPLRYRDVAASFDGLGPLLADNLDRGPMVQQIAQIVAQKLPAAWIEQQEDARTEHGAARKLGDMMGFFLGKTAAGFGIERCLYEANPELPCRSPLLERDHIAGIQHLLGGLDRVAAGIDVGTELIDRHVAAFIGARLGSTADAELMRLSSAPQHADRCIALLRLLATVQASAGVYELHNLGAWVAKRLEPLVDSFHHRPFKEALAREIGPLCYRGDFVGLVRLVENDGLRRRDESGFAQARRRYAGLQQEAQWVRGGGMTARPQLREAAGQAAAVTAGVVAVAVGGTLLAFAAG